MHIMFPTTCSSGDTSMSMMIGGIAGMFMRACSTKMHS